jgi:aromatic ring-opening dioxygenase catalytic subunit (LigB family)
MSISQRMPVIFFGHGNPISVGWSQIGKTIPRPKAIVAVSLSIGVAAHFSAPLHAPSCS